MTTLSSGLQLFEHLQCMGDEREEKTHHQGKKLL